MRSSPSLGPGVAVPAIELPGDRERLAALEGDEGQEHVAARADAQVLPLGRTRRAEALRLPRRDALDARAERLHAAEARLAGVDGRVALEAEEPLPDALRLVGLAPVRGEARLAAVAEGEALGAAALGLALRRRAAPAGALLGPL